MGNEIRARYSADISQLEIANDKLAAQNEKLSRQVATMTARASGFNKTYGNSWNAVRARVEEYTRAVKGATNLREWYGAIEKLQGAQREFEQINAAVNEVTAGQKEAVAVATHMANSYNDLEARLRDVREQMKQFAASSDDFRRLALEEQKVKEGLESINMEVQRIQLEAKGNQSIRTIDQLSKRIAELRAQYKLMGDADPAKAVLAAKIEKMQAAYDRLSVSAKRSTATLQRNAETAKVAADSIKGLDQQIEHMTRRASSMSSTSKEFEVLTGQIRRLTTARQKLQSVFKPVESKPERTVSAVDLGSLEAKTMQRDYLEKMARGISGKSFDAATAKIRQLNAEIQKMESAFKKAEDTMIVDPVVINSVEGLTARIAHLQEMMNRVDNGQPMFSVSRQTGQVEQSGTTARASTEYMRMAETLVRLKKELKGLKDLQNIPVETVVTARKSYDALREAIERTRKARDAAVKGSPEFNAQEAKLQKLEAGYKRLTAATDNQTKAAKRQAAIVRVAGDSMQGLEKQIEFLQGRLATVSKGAEFDRLSSIIAKLQTRLKGLQTDAGKASAAMSKGATAAAGSFTRLDYELKKAKEDLKGMAAGTQEFIAQQMKVQRIQEHWDKLDQTINRTEKAQKRQAGIMGTVSGQAKSFLATYLGIHQVMTEITAEWEKQRTFQLDAANKGAAIKGELVRQAPNIGGENLKGIAKWARDNQVELLAKQEEIIGLVGAAISAGAPTLEAAKKVTAAALKINVGDKELANELLQGGITVGRLNNSDDFEAAFGQLRSSSKASQAVDENEFLGNILGKMAALTRGRKNMDGMTTERALEYMTAASRIQVDRTGDTSSTNMAAIYQRMDDFMPELKKVLKDKSVSRVDQKTIDAFKAARTFDEKLALLRSNKDLGNQFIDKQRTGGPRELAFAMVQNDKNVRALMKEAEDAVVPFAQAGAVFKEATDQIRDAVPGLIANRELAAGKEFAATSDREMLLGQARAAYDSIWNADANGNAPVNLSGWDRGKRAMVGTEMEFRRGGTKRDGTAFNEAEILAFGVQKLLGAELQKRGSDRNQPAVDSLTKQLTVLEKIATHLESLDNKANGERFLPPERRAMMPPLAFRPRVLAPAAAAAAAAR